MTHTRISGMLGAALSASMASLVVACTVAGCGKHEQPAEAKFIPPIIPAPAEAFAEAGVFPVSAKTPVVASGDAVSVANYFVDLVKRTKGLDLAVGEQAGDTPGIRFEVSGTIKTARGIRAHREARWGNRHGARQARIVLRAGRDAMAIAHRAGIPRTASPR